MLLSSKKFYLRLIFIMVLYTIPGRVCSQLILTNGAPSASIDFSNAMQTSVGTNTSTAFTGAGFSAAPSNATPGRLNSNAWAVTGWSDGDLVYGGSQITASQDYTRGSTAVAVTPGGMYAYIGSPATVANPTLMIQPGGSDFTVGTLTLRIQNNGTTIINQLALSYNLYVRNDQGRSTYFNLSYSTDDATYTDVPALAYTTPVATDALGWVLVGTAPSRSTTITGISIPPGTYAYIRWTSGDVAGTLNRDEIGLDDISLTATYTSPCSPPSTQASVSSFSNVLSSQMDLNFTRGNGTGGVMIIASTSPTLSANPVSGITYTANANYGNGSALGGGYAVYAGAAAGTLAAATQTITGLSPSTNYYFYLFEYDITVPCYTTVPGTGNQLTATGSATSPTDYFQSQTSGNWNNANTWQSSASLGGPWITATIKPTLSAKGIAILATHTVTITADETANKLSIAATATLTYLNGAAGGYNLSIPDDPSGTDLQVSGTYEIFGIQPTLASGATAVINSGGIVRATGNAGTFTSDDFARSSSVLFKSGSVFDWNNTLAFESSSKTYFPNAGSEIATFRISKNMASVGANTFTTINGLFEVNGTITFVNTGDKTFRNGIIGTALLTQSGICQFIIDGSTAQLGGTGAITLNASGRLRIAVGSVTTMISNKTINSGPITVDGTLYTAANIISGSSSFALSAAGTLGMGSPDGITTGALGNVQVAGARTFDPAGNYIYNSVVANQNTGNALPAAITGFLSISNTGTAGNNTVSLTTNNTTVTTFNLVNGFFAAGAGQNLKIASGGTVTGSGGNQSILPAIAGIIYFIGSGTVTPPTTGLGLSLTNAEIHGGVSFSTASYFTTIRDTLNIGSGGFVNVGSAPIYSSTPASTLLYTCNCPYGAYEEWYPNTFGTGPGVPHNVTLAAGTSLNFQSNTNTREMRGDLLIGSGSTFALSTASGGDLNIKGNWTRAATGIFTPNTRAVRFNGTSGNQTVTVTGGGTETFAYLLINKASGQSLVLSSLPATNITVNGGGGSNTLQLSGGDLDLNQQTLNFISYYNANQNGLGIDGSAGDLTRNITSTGGTGILAVSDAYNVTHFMTIGRLSGNASLLVLGSNVTTTITGTAPGGGGINFGNGLTTVNGTLQINSYGYVTGFAPAYGTNSFLVYNSGSSFDRNVEWGALSGPGYPYNVVVQNGTGIRLNTPAINGNADRAIAGNLSIVAGSSLLLSTTANNTLTVGKNLILDGTLTLPTVYGGDIYIGGNWNRSATGVFNPNNRAVFFNGSGNSTITANGGQPFPYLYLSKSALANSLTLLDNISISKEFSVLSGTFDPASKDATIQSNATNGTADFGQMGAAGDVAYSGTGRFIVERFIPTGTISGEHIKSWQFLAVPDNGGQSINAAWQEGNVLPATGTNGLGTIITSNIPGAGFDIIGGSGPSMKTYAPLTNTWIGVANTNPLPIFNQKGYFVFVRGDRRVSAYNTPADSTTLRTRGKLFVPSSNPPASTTISAGKFESIGNPYASAINFQNITRPAAPAIDSVFYVWDPLLAGSYGLGGFQTISSVTGYKPTPGGTANYNSALVYTSIQSGQAFLMHATGAGGTVSFTENAKLAGSSMVFKNSDYEPADRRYFRSAIYTTAGNMADANVVAFDRSFNNAYETNDALKILNAGENLGIASNLKILSVEARKPVLITDTIHYTISNLKVQAYQFRFAPENMQTPGLKAWLVDHFLHTSVPVSLEDSSAVDFAITSDPASAATDRFMLVFRQKQTILSPAIPTSGEIARIAQKEVTAITEPQISVYPNPVPAKNIQLSFRNKPAGNYKLQLLNSAGLAVYETVLMVTGNDFNTALHVTEIAAGYYNLSVTAANGDKTILPVVMK